MTVHRKCEIFLVILCATGCMARSPGSDIRVNNVSEDSDEDENIKQALVLVNLLKHEYVKALRENNEIRMRTTLTEESTCAPGDRPTSTSESATTEQHSGTPLQPARISMAGRRMAVVTPFQRTIGRNALQPYQFFRRRAPVDYYYGGGTVVGEDYDYPIDHLRRRGNCFHGVACRCVANKNEQPVMLELLCVPFRRQEGPTDASNDIPPPVTPDPDTPGPNTPDLNTPDPDTQGSSTQDFVTPDPAAAELDTELDTEADVTESDDAYPEETENTLPSNEEEDLVQGQIASQLKDEMEAPALADTYTYVPSDMNKDKTTKRYLHRIKPTLKVYLGGSTRYQIPLSENHAFCYTNPRNKLCRTSI